MPRHPTTAVQTPRLVGADPHDTQTIDWVADREREVEAVRTRLRELRGELATPLRGAP